jgi:hypothetical protein
MLVQVEHVEGVVKRREEALHEATISHEQGLNKVQLVTNAQ